MRSASESEYAAVVVRWLEAHGADVYAEVEVPGGIADIVSVRGPELTIVETKTSWSLSLVAQALDRRRHAHRVYIAAPSSKSNHDVRQLCAELGVGMLKVSLGSPGSTWDLPRVDEVVESRRWNRRPVALRGKLRPEHKTAAPAGHAGGGRWTPFRDTCQQIVEIVRAEPGISIKELVDRTRGHYATAASARSAIANWVQVGRIPGVRADHDGRKLRLFLDDNVKRRNW